MNMHTPSKPSAPMRPVASSTLAVQPRDAADAVTNSVSDAIDSDQAALSRAGVDAKKMSDIAIQQIKIFAEAMTQRNPLGTIASAVVVGILIGMLSRGRSD
jgi:ElaB/YqjD/DUF883 family membrane-anchored ribosome-binding protein